MENKDAVKFYNKTWFMWITLIFFAPVGIFLMWKNKRYHKVVRVVLSGFFGLIFGILVFAPRVEQQKAKEQFASTQDFAKSCKEENEKKEVTLEQFMQQTKDTKIIKVNDCIKDNNAVVVIAKQNCAVRNSYYLTCYNILKQIKDYKNYNKIKKVDVMIMADLQDVYGNVKEGKVFSGAFSKEDLDKINWDNFLWENTGKLATNVWMHPCTREKMFSK